MPTPGDEEGHEPTLTQRVGNTCRLHSEEQLVKTSINVEILIRGNLLKLEAYSLISRV